MKIQKSLGALLIATTLFVNTPNAEAGIGLSANALNCLVTESYLGAAITGGLGAASIVHGVSLATRGRIGWAVFFIVLKEKNVLSDQDTQILEGLDVSTQEAMMSILSSDLSQDEKNASLQELLN